MKENSPRWWAVMIGLTLLWMYTFAVLIHPFSNSVADGVWAFLIGSALSLGEMYLSVYLVLRVMHLLGWDEPSEEEKEQDAQAAQHIVSIVENFNAWKQLVRERIEREQNDVEKPPASNEPATGRSIP